MKKINLKSTLLGLLLVGTFAIVGSDTKVEASTEPTVWTARTVEQVKADLNGNTYEIKWGDTLGVISEAVNIKVETLQVLNNITNANLIFAGNTLVFEGNTMTTQSITGETIQKVEIKEEQKIDPSKPIGNENVKPTKPTENGNGNNEGTTKPEGGNNGGNEGGNNGDNEGGNNGGNEGGNNGGNEGGNNGDNEGGNNGGNEGGNNGGNEGGNNGGNEGGNNGGNEGGNNGGNEGGNNGGETPSEEKNWTVWLNVDDSQFASKNIAIGTHTFKTNDEARAWIEAYADGLLMEGISASDYGTVYIGG